MALIRQMKFIEKERNMVHQEVECSYTLFREGRETILQLDTYGSADRALPGKVSQSIQFNRESAAHLRRLLDRYFPESTAVR